MQHTPLQLPALEASSDEITENIQDELETEWIDAVNARYGHVSEPVANTSDPGHCAETVGGSEPLDIVNHILSASSLSGPSVPPQLDAGDVDMPLRSYVNPENQRVISEMRDGRTIAIGFLPVVFFFSDCVVFDFV